MAARYGVTASRFVTTELDDCVRCGLCIRVCRDKIGISAISFAGRGQKRRVTAEFGHISKTCIGCGSCANICPTGAIQLHDEKGIRTISLKNNVTGRFVLVQCPSCGVPYATKRMLEYVAARIEGHPTASKRGDFCPECTRIHAAEAIGGDLLL
jgi:formate hydrogenlyase subunit 6/NADH:ubiquinone oxidoreductase subunit I